MDLIIKKAFIVFAFILQNQFLSSTNVLILKYYKKNWKINFQLEDYKEYHHSLNISKFMD